MLSITPLVSICCIAYNHEKFIRSALDGFFIQQTSFAIEIVIHDDASTDNTTNIILEYQNKYPGSIDIIMQAENQYSQRGFGFIADLFAKAQGKYIALCEGDDYWIDPLKLQKQVDFLESNPEFAICFHKVKIEEEGKFKDDYITGGNPPIVSNIIDLAKGNYIHTPSCVFRNNTSKILGANFADSPLGDYYINMMNAQYGNIFHIDEIMAVYRIHSSSTFSSQSRNFQIAKTIKAIEVISKDLQKQEVEVRQQLIDAHIHLTMDIYDRSLLIKDFENTSITFYPSEYRQRLIENLINSEEKIAILTNQQESIKWLIMKLVNSVKKRILKIFT
ncbi:MULTISPECIES: glycosyltransferase [unclassified Chamaesiphon]|uniref:glycosyltransferase family 2 protein n=1 Tax=unclassified Chamaesiphon TaxID=2620921 RepID=UPI00286CBA55|nr:MULTISPECIES: glycosyltransferase [unclassified Chamaesiphon]